MPTGPSLLRAVEVVIDRASWRAQPSQFRHPFPRALGRQRGPFPVHLLKVGAMKMADYAALDSSGKFHLIECKGTQHSPGGLASAMADGQLQK
jgi:hypothetical protein